MLKKKNKFLLILLVIFLLILFFKKVNILVVETQVIIKKNKINSQNHPDKIMFKKDLYNPNNSFNIEYTPHMKNFNFYLNFLNERDDNDFKNINKQFLIELGIRSKYFNLDPVSDNLYSNYLKILFDREILNNFFFSFKKNNSFILFFFDKNDDQYISELIKAFQVINILYFKHEQLFKISSCNYSLLKKNSLELNGCKSILKTNAVKNDYYTYYYNFDAEINFIERNNLKSNDLLKIIFFYLMVIFLFIINTFFTISLIFKKKIT